MEGTCRGTVAPTLLIVTALLVVLPATAADLGPQGDQALWSAHGGDARHTSLSTLDASGNKGGLAWRFETNGTVASSPAVAADGTIYFGSEDGTFYALNPNGTLKWKYLATSGIISSPAIAMDGTVYVAATISGDLNPQDYSVFALYAFETNGTLRWIHELGAQGISSPTVGPDGTVFICSSRGASWEDVGLQAIGPDGELRWRITTWNEAVSTPAVGLDGTAYFGTFGGSLYSANGDGSVNWNWAIPNGEGNGAEMSSPAIGADGTVYYGSSNHNLYALSPELRPTGDGENGSVLASPKWSFETSGCIVSTPAIGSDGTIYVGSSEDRYDRQHEDLERSGEIIGAEQYLYAMGLDGSLKWKFPVEGCACSSPSISSDGTIFFLDWSGHLYALDEDGGLKWRYGPLTASGPAGLPLSPPAIGLNGTVYVNDGNSVCAIYQGGPSSPEEVRSSRTPGKVTVTWSAPSTDGGYPVTAYNIYRTVTYEDDSFELRKFIASVGPGVRSFVDESLPDNCSCSYQVSCNNSAGESGMTYGPFLEPLRPADLVPSFLVYAAVPVAAGIGLLFYLRKKGRM